LKEKTINIALQTLGGNFFGTKFCYKYDSYYEVNERLLENFIFLNSHKLNLDYDKILVKKKIITKCESSYNIKIKKII
jgi:hypothetical protein